MQIHLRTLALSCLRVRVCLPAPFLDPTHRTPCHARRSALCDHLQEKRTVLVITVAGGAFAGDDDAERGCRCIRVRVNTRTRAYDNSCKHTHTHTHTHTHHTHTALLYLVPLVSNSVKVDGSSMWWTTACRCLYCFFFSPVIHIHTHVCMYGCMCMYVCKYVFMYVCTYVYIYIYI